MGNNKHQCIAVVHGRGCRNKGAELIDVLYKEGKAIWGEDFDRMAQNMPGWFLRRDAALCTSHMTKIKAGREVAVKWPPVQMPLVNDTSPPRVPKGVKCGNCTKRKLPNPYHATVGEVRDCYDVTPKEKSYEVFTDRSEALAQAKAWNTSMVPRNGKFIVPKPKS